MAAMLLRSGVNGSKHSTNMLGDGPAPIWYGCGGVWAPVHAIHTKFRADTVNVCVCGLECTTGLAKRIRHTSGTVGGRGSRPS